MKKSAEQKLKIEMSDAYLGALKEQFNGGHKSALISAIRECGRSAIAMPEWVVSAFFKATNRWVSMEVKTLDEAFELEWPKGKHFAAARKNRRLSFAVYGRCKQLIDSGQATDNTLFESVGREYGVGRSVASRYYYCHKK